MHAAIALFCLSFCFSSPAGDDPAPNTLSDAEKSAGFKLLFDGKSTDGWRGYKKESIPEGWKVEDGSLTRVDSGGDIVTHEQFGNFDLRIDWRVAPGGNSGIMYHVQETEKAPYMTGPEFQVLDNERHPDGKSKMTSAGSCYGLYPPTKDVCKPAGEWNQARIVVKGAHVEHWLNGEKVADYEKGGAEWNEKVASTKFNQWPQFGKPKTGHICLQDHGDKVEYRNIKIRVIEESK